MIDGIAAEVAGIPTQDPRTPSALRQPGKPFARMDSPLFRIALRHVAAALQPCRYLEIGVKEGGSLAMVLDASARLERVVLCDFFTINAKKRKHRAAAAAELERRRFGGSVAWLDGSSVVTVPLLAETFELVGIDGSHRRSILAADLRNAGALVSPGGYIVVDDLILFEDGRLEHAFDAFTQAHSEAWTVVHKNVTHWPGVGVLRRDV